ncbi:MAG: DNA repair protein RadA [Thermodesulfobacteriota bacterium]|nr:MAG: DNA repair protein RadA [Thermodesulfobacteriota bacterium]
MAKRGKIVFTCQSCGHVSYKWLGRCPECDSWNSFLEEMAAENKGLKVLDPGEPALPITAIEAADDKSLKTGIGEFDRVLGGGMVPGSAVLIGGDPGIGKSTLMLQAMGRFAAQGRKVLYVTGEESPGQIRLRGTRLGAVHENLMVYSETCLERVIDAIRKSGPEAVVIDSVQTLYTTDMGGSPGSLGQLREVSARLISLAKKSGVPLFLIGHVTKEGFIAGPRVLEHMVDTVLYFEGERNHVYRILRAVKNRFGSVMEIGIFEMGEAGLKEVKNPSEIFLAERPVGASGSAVIPSLEGTRVVLVEVQALICPTIFGVPRRTIVGIDHNRVMLLAAVLEKKASLTLANNDIFVKVAGGIRLDEPAADLAVIASIASNFLDKPMDPKTVVFGEVGLTGEVRAVSQAAQRVKEAYKLGFETCVIAKDNLKGLKKTGSMEFTAVSTIKEAVKKIF